MRETSKLASYTPSPTSLPPPTCIMLARVMGSPMLATNVGLVVLPRQNTLGRRFSRGYLRGVEGQGEGRGSTVYLRSSTVPGRRSHAGSH